MQFRDTRLKPRRGGSGPCVPTTAGGSHGASRKGGACHRGGEAFTKCSKASVKRQKHWVHVKKKGDVLFLRTLFQRKKKIHFFSLIAEENIILDRGDYTQKYLFRRHNFSNRGAVRTPRCRGPGLSSVGERTGTFADPARGWLRSATPQGAATSARPGLGAGRPGQARHCSPRVFTVAGNT